MENAWLDSLSEDWISQPRSDESPVGSLPSLSDSTSAVGSSKGRDSSSRIPFPITHKELSDGANPGSSPLSERSANNNNIALSQRGLRRPSKLRNEITYGRGRAPSRTVSGSSASSVQYNTVQHKSHSLSPQKLNRSNDTPEWKKRLLHGDVAYGEQRDLFSPAGLENMFRPPPPSQTTHFTSPIQQESETLNLPSSPPPYNHSAPPRSNQTSTTEAGKEQQLRVKNEPKSMKYRATETSRCQLPEDGSSRGANSDSITFDDAGNTSQKHPHNSLPHESNSDIQGSLPSNIKAGDPRRLVSGLSDVRHEDLSPIYISRHNTVDGRIDYAPLDVTADELHERLQLLSVDKEDEDYLDGGSAQYEGVTTNTDDFAHDGHFVNIERGGRSLEGSFQQRLLSPSSLPSVDESAILQEGSIEASTPKQLPNMRKTRVSNEYRLNKERSVSPPRSHTPEPSFEIGDVLQTKSSSGSPLKLFGTYDTFTNQKLLRRLSQFEKSLPNGDSDQSLSNPGTRYSNHDSRDPTGMDEAHIAASSATKGDQTLSGTQNRYPPRKFSSFGKGDLDGFEFNEEASLQSSSVTGQRALSLNFGSSSSTSLDQDRHSRRYKRRPSKSASAVPSLNSTRQRVSSFLPISRRSEVLDTPRKTNGDTEGKRLPKSPLKDPTPKRRRTLHKTDISHITSSEIAASSVKETHAQMQSVLGKKRKDAVHNDNLQSANAQVMATRQILRPRTPTPSRRGSQEHGHSENVITTLHWSQKTKFEQEAKIARVQAELDAVHHLDTPSGVGPSAGETSRKPSVTTQDFLDEAKKIMAGIRGKARPGSGLASVEESESDSDRHEYEQSPSQEGQEDDSYEESTREPFSRPPSREGGGPLPRLPHQQNDPELLSHLRKYEEVSDIDVVIASSMKSIGLTKDAMMAASALDKLANDTINKASSRTLDPDMAYQSDPPNAQITEYPELQRKRKHFSSSVPSTDEEALEAEFPSNGSSATSDPSTGLSIPTGSSRGSDTKRVIAAHTISHLIPEQLAGMVFNRERGIWVKRKAANAQHKSDNHLPSDDTDDDPFGDIPDLTVDETQENQRVKEVAAKTSQETRISEIQEYQQRQLSTMVETMTPTPGDTDIPFEVANSDSVPSSEPSKFTRFGSSDAAQNTRVTSWGDEQEFMTKTSSGSNTEYRVQTNQTCFTTETTQEDTEEVEQEITIQESRIPPSPDRRRRNVTISFSSPLASVIHQHEQFDEIDSDNMEDDHDDLETSINDTINDMLATPAGSRRNLQPAKTRSSQKQRTSRRVSLRAHSFLARPVSRIDEQDEGSFIYGLENTSQRRSVSLVISTPLQARAVSTHLATIPPSSVTGKNQSLYQLSPLSDFTMNQNDASFALELSYVAPRRTSCTANGTRRSLSLSVKDLVQRITDVEPYEPFWEHIKHLDLKGKQLQSLHMLGKFCGQIQELEVSGNKISQLDGAPQSIRRLQIMQNSLTDMVSWDHLSNLQYVDVSNNNLTSLQGFKNLIHLRSLRADGNQIQSLNGILHLDGLISLRLRDNVVDSVDFEGSALQRLTDLDLKNNCVCDIRNLQELSSLSTLNLEDNALREFQSDNGRTMSTLKYLKLSGNNLENLDISRFPDLRLLYLDRNRLVKVSGLLKTKHLDSLSMREQQEGSVIDTSFLDEAFEVRKLFLSGNLLTSFSPRVDFLNLQYLELANCGLENLPAEFGQMLSNVRVLNLNFNALRDISPLWGIVRLKKVHLSGNRLTRLRKTTNTLAQFSSLVRVDLRNNPLTLGFYPPIIETRIVVRADSECDSDALPIESFTLEDADRVRDSAYARRLDMETKTRRRVFEMLMSGGCTRLKVLDGLVIERDMLGAHDQVWEELVKAGVVNGGAKGINEPALESHRALVDRKDVVDFPTEQAKDAQNSEAENKEKNEEKETKEQNNEEREEEGRWDAEDSFA